MDCSKCRNCQYGEPIAYVEEVFDHSYVPPVREVLCNLSFKIMEENDCCSEYKKRLAVPCESDGPLNWL